MQFADLNEINLRAAWPDEARDFTPWLSENLERLSRTLGIPMELEDIEVPVEQFSADVLARNPTDNSLILIENQLEQTDHSHLGQIMTYLAGLQAQTIIWIAREFREPHLSAVRWLNDHTSDPFSFFAIQVKVVRIGNDESSPVSPVFEVLEKPNEWDRRITDTKNEALNELQKYRHDFWQSYAQEYPEDIQIRPNHIGANVFHNMSGLVVSQYLAKGNRSLHSERKPPVHRRGPRVGQNLRGKASGTRHCRWTKLPTHQRQPPSNIQGPRQLASDEKMAPRDAGEIPGGPPR